MLRGFIGVALAAVTASAPMAFADEISFTRDIRPILSDRCFACHGPDAKARKAGLRLDTFRGATSPRGEKPAAIVPGAPAQSPLLERLRSDDPHFRMPPPESKLRVEPHEVDLIERWIDSGARFETHWSFVPPQRPERPSTANRSWCRDPLDDFVLARLEETGLTPAPDSDRATFLRRVTFDLTGLPPTSTEIDGFLADTAPGSHERVVDRLLASPRFGERMASVWLDVARYADTYGYQNDVYRDVWPWRDWVVEAFNDNLPYDEFVTWQLAGDLLPNPTRDQRLATAFQRLHRQTNEGGSVEEEYRVEYVSDRLHTFGTAFLGLTLECARCHDHKYDPISAKEYYELSAFFNSIDECGLYSHFTNATPTPALDLPTAEQERRLTEARQAVAHRARELKSLVRSRREEFRRWLGAADDGLAIPGEAARIDFENVEGRNVVNRSDPEKPAKLVEDVAVVNGELGAAARFSGDNAVHLPQVGHFTRYDAFSLEVWLKTPDVKERAVVARRSRAWTDAGSQGYQLLIRDGQLEWSLVHFWPGNAVSVRAVNTLPVDRWVHVVVTHDGSARARGLRIYVDGVRTPTLAVRDGLTRSITGGGPGPLALGERFRDRGFTGGEIAEVAVFDRCLTDLEVRHLNDDVALDAARSAPDAATNDDLYLTYLGAVDAEYGAAATRLREARKDVAKIRDGIRSIMTMKELEEPRETYVLERGSYRERRERVSRRVPVSLPPLAESRRDRLTLARWLARDDNPLFSRVAVNRLWQMVFGRGLVFSAENFGSQGTYPTHTKLLDYLAVEYRESGWDTKALLRRLVLSGTYRQRSRPTQLAAERDPENLLWSRGPKKRLSAEMIRDAALQASGLLVGRIGGRSVRPYQPEGLWKEKGNVVYKPDEGDGLYRRSLYTIWKRTSPPPSMMIFDAVKRDVCVVRRQPTSTPLQALVLWNDPQLVEASRMLAARSLSEVTGGLEERVRFIFRELTGRRPTSKEHDVLLALGEEEQRSFGEKPEEARRLLGVGETPVPEGLDPITLAAHTVVVSTLLGYDAFVVLR